VGQQRRERAVAELVGRVPEPARDQLLALHLRAPDVLAAVGAPRHVALVREPLEQLLHGCVFRGRAAGIEGVGQRANRGRAVVPEHAEHLALGVRHVLRPSCHAAALRAEATQTSCLGN
jgi:hypothetical protein